MSLTTQDQVPKAADVCLARAYRRLFLELRRQDQPAQCDESGGTDNDESDNRAEPNSLLAVEGE